MIYADTCPKIGESLNRLDSQVCDRVNVGDHDVLRGLVLRYDYNLALHRVFCPGEFFAEPQSEAIP